MGDHARRAHLAHAIHDLEISRAGDSGTCSACHFNGSADEDQRAFETAGRKLQQRIAAVRPLITDSAGRKALDAIDNGVSQWIYWYRSYLSKPDASFNDMHDIITQKMLPTLAEIDRSTMLLSAQQRAFFEESNTSARLPPAATCG